MSTDKSKKRQRSRSSNTKKPKALVDIIVPFYGEIELAKEAIASVPDACGDIAYNLIVVDNGSPENLGRELFEHLDQEGVEFRKIWLKQNQGYPGAVNAGVHAGSAPLVFILTSDVIMDPGSIAVAVREMDNPEVGVVGCKLLFPEETPHGEAGKIQHAGLAMNLNGQIFHIFIGWSADHPKVNIKRDMIAMTGAAFMTRRTLFLKVGGMATEYGLGTYEDVEYCMLVKAAKKKIRYVPEVSGTHHVGGSIAFGANPSGFALGQNQSLFEARMSWAFEWDEWRYW
jgi:GT2 family glycosyltransferase